jgi:hypothetical protein
MENLTNTEIQILLKLVNNKINSNKTFYKTLREVSKEDGKLLCQIGELDTISYKLLDNLVKE